MKSHGEVAASVRKEKESAVGVRKYCANPNCLWRILQKDGSSTPCPRHPAANLPREVSK